MSGEVVRPIYAIVTKQTILLDDYDLHSVHNKQILPEAAERACCV